MTVAPSWSVLPTCTVALAGWIETDPDEPWTIDRMALPLVPSMVAVTVTWPGPTAETRPFELTGAMPGALLAHVTGLPLTRPPAAFHASAVS
jgi:hypothetical protein